MKRLDVANWWTSRQSLPSRERGLKRHARELIGSQPVSLPSRERGLKPATDFIVTHGGQSLPSRERGLKPGRADLPGPGAPVAPFTGAWIETDRAENVEPLRQGRSLHGSVD